MPRDVNGNTQPLPGTIVSTGDTVLPSQHNPAMVDLYAMITQSLSRDGQGGMRAPLDMSGFVIRNVGTATLDSDAVSLEQSRLAGVPIGASVDFAGSLAPEKWMLCFGQEISRATYADLFSVIGTAYGNGNGSTTFNLPDCRGRITAGKDDMGGTDAKRLSTFFGSVARTLGGVLGAASHVLTIGQIPRHRHSGTTGNAGGHSHTGSAGDPFEGGNTFGRGAASTGPISVSTSSVPNHNHSFTTDYQGSDDAHPNAQPTIIMNKIIKVSY